MKKHTTNTRSKNQEGIIIIFSLVFMLVVIMLVGALVGYASIQLKSHRQAVSRVVGLNVAEAGVETAIWKLNNVIGYSGETNAAYGGGVYDVTISNLSGSSKLITVDSYIPNKNDMKARRTIQVTAVIGTVNIGFNYGVQVGNGGLEMSNSTKVIGNVYANSDIIGANSAKIEGTAIVAGPTGVIDGMDITGDSWSHTIRGNSNVDGNARHSVLEQTDVIGNVEADSISGCDIDGDAIYDNRSSCTVDGTATTPNPNDFEYAPVVPLPISEEQIDVWETEAAAGGTLSTQNFDTGSRNLGPVKINGDLILSNTAQVVVTGTIWVTGQISLTNSAILKLSPSYGALGGVVMAGIDESSTAGHILIDNSVQVLGSGTAGSYILILSQKEGVATPAITQNNGTGTAVLYAGEGLIEIGNFTSMKEITAEKLRLTNQATITYEGGLSNANFSSGPGGGWEIASQSWQLIR